MILLCLQNISFQGSQNEDIQKREGQPASIREGNLLTEVTPVISQGLQKDDVQHLHYGDIQETYHIKKMQNMWTRVVTPVNPQCHQNGDLQKTETQFHLRTKEMTAVISKCPNQTMDQ